MSIKNQTSKEPSRAQSKESLYLYALNLIEREHVCCSVIEFGSAWRFMSGDRLGVFDRAAVFQIGSNARGSERVTADSLRFNAGSEGSALNHPQHIGAAHS